jgi:hypothetical protein
MGYEGAQRGDRELRERGYAVIDLDLVECVTRYAGTPIKWDIVTFFAENPYSRDVASHIAGRIGRSEGVVFRELEDLVLLGFLQKSRLGDACVYHVSDVVDRRSVLARFAATF